MYCSNCHTQLIVTLQKQEVQQGALGAPHLPERSRSRRDHGGSRHPKQSQPSPLRRGEKEARRAGRR